MSQKLLIGGIVVAGLYSLYQQGVSNTPGVGDPGDTNPDGTAADGTDAGVIDDVQVALNLVPDYVGAWADAITVHEGWRDGSRSYRNNNPGNLEVDGDLGRDSGGYGVFSSYNAGRNALLGDLTAKVRKYSSWTLYQVMARYAPPSENNTQAYANAVGAALGVSSTTRVGDIAGIWSNGGRTWQPLAFSSQPAAAPSSASDVTLADNSASLESILDGTSDPSAAVDFTSLDFPGGDS